MNENTIISISHLTKSYRNAPALNDVSFEIEKGEGVGLLGPNGAGKTTLVKCLLGLIYPDSGELSINGHKVPAPKGRTNIAYLPEKFNFFPYYTVENTLQFFGQIRNVKSSLLKDQINHALNAVQADKIKHKKVSKISKGQLQRVGMASLMIGNPEILILDEPFSGLDPIGIKELKELLLSLKKQGKTILMNSHILAEVEKICDQVVILNEGVVRAQENLNELKNKGTKNLEDYFYSVIKGQKLS